MMFLKSHRTHPVPLIISSATDLVLPMQLESTWNQILEYLIGIIMPRSSSQALEVLFSISSDRILGLKGIVEVQELVVLAYAFRILDGLC